MLDVRHLQYNSYCFKAPAWFFTFKEKKILFYLCMMEHFQFSLVMFGGNSVGRYGKGSCMVMKCGRTVKLCS